MAREYRIEFTIQSSDDGWQTVDEVGFGSSGSEAGIDQASFALDSIVQNGQWETEGAEQ